MSIETKQVRVRPKNEEKRSSMERRKKGSTVSLSKTELQKSVGPILSLRRAGVKDATGQVLVFFVKMAALEVFRRGSQGKYRPLWWGLQSLSVFQAPPLKWLQRWAPFRFLAQATQSFSKPMICLSLATVVASAYKEVSQEKTPVVAHISSSSELPAIDVINGELKEEEIVVIDQQAHTVGDLRQELENNGIVLPERMDDDEVERFGVAAKGDVPKFVESVKKTVKWREVYHFLSQPDLKSWRHLVFWHVPNQYGFPTLIIRLGLAYCSLEPFHRPRFAQAIVSQVEYGLQNIEMLDGRLTVVMDCHGTSALGFPVHMMKSCSVLVQENYPTRLASLLIINLPPVVRVIANAVMQVVKPSTREKVHMEGENYKDLLADHLGGIFCVPAVLGGKCSCSPCEEIRAAKERMDMSLVAHRARSQNEQLEERDLVLEESAYSERLSVYQSYQNVLRVIILGLLMLWIVVATVGGYYEPQSPPT